MNDLFKLFADNIKDENENESEKDNTQLNPDDIDNVAGGVWSPNRPPHR